MQNIESVNNFKVLGLMSGTSLDGLDVAYCHFRKQANGWRYQLKVAETIPYARSWRKHLSTAQHMSAVELVSLDFAYGEYLGSVCRDFIRRHKLRVDFIASHGHTIFHQPENGFTFQLGNGNALHAQSAIPVVFDFRSLDVQRGGEGAPLVPLGDALLFADFDVCLNLGGIANLSADVKGSRHAFDICFCNMALNFLMQSTGKQFDKGGRLSSRGSVNDGLKKDLDKVNAKWRSKRLSLGRELFERHVQPMLSGARIPVHDKLRTVTASIADEIADAFRAVRRSKKSSVLCTGGGVFNTFLISELLERCGDDFTLILPEDDVIKFKEAIVFAFLGVRRVRQEINCFRSVTGATQDSSSGSMIGF
jgi:anhydro-N-acetylmuramic acid kinase